MDLNKIAMGGNTTTSRRQIILDTVEDLVSSLLYYDRTEDSQLGIGDIEDAINSNEITAEEILSKFNKIFIERLSS